LEKDNFSSFLPKCSFFSSRKASGNLSRSQVGATLNNTNVRESGVRVRDSLHVYSLRFLVDTALQVVRVESRSKNHVDAIFLECNCSSELSLEAGRKHQFGALTFELIVSLKKKEGKAMSIKP
jgi:hypothetical protein